MRVGEKMVMADSVRESARLERGDELQQKASHSVSDVGVSIGVTVILSSKS